MSKLKEKLDEVHGKKNRASILNAIDGEFHQAIKTAEFSCDKNKLKYGAWSTWKNGEWTTTRGRISTWAREELETWDDVLSGVSSLSLSKTEKGWLLFSAAGPYFRVDGLFIEKHMEEISKYSKKHESFDIAWIGDERDFGIIIESNETDGGKFELCKWGL